MKKPVQPKCMMAQKRLSEELSRRLTIKYTKTNQTMAILTLEDLLGTVEVVVFPERL